MASFLRLSKTWRNATGISIAASAAFSLVMPMMSHAQGGDAIAPATNPSIGFRRPLRVSNLQIANNREHRRSDYFFTFDFPAEAIEPLEKIVFEQIEGADYPRYSVDGSYAFIAGNPAQPSQITVDNNRAERRLIVEFDPPIAPGNPVTVALRARNPNDGIYVYRLTAFPSNATEGQYAGVEQLTFREPIRRRDFRFWP